MLANLTLLDNDPVQEQYHGEFLDLPYLRMLNTVYNYGLTEMDRTGTGTRSVFGLSARYDLRSKFPLLTSKRMPWKNTVQELLWILSGSTNAGELEALGNKFWAYWGDPNTRELGPVYGKQWRDFSVPGAENHRDQLTDLIKNLQEQPFSRRHVVTLWNPLTVDQAALPCCHGIAIQFKVQQTEFGLRLHSSMYQRSCDLFLGCPVNIASYALLTCILARCLGYKPGFFFHAVGDTHIYLNHMDVVSEQLDRPLLSSPTLEIPELPEDFLFQENLLEKWSEIVTWLRGYNPHSVLKAPVAI